MTDRLAVIELIGATTTKTGLKVECALDTGSYEKVSNAEMAGLDITGDPLHPEWNYTIKPEDDAKIVAGVAAGVLRCACYIIPEFSARLFSRMPLGRWGPVRPPDPPTDPSPLPGRGSSGTEAAAAAA